MGDFEFKKYTVANADGAPVKCLHVIVGKFDYRIIDVRIGSRHMARYIKTMSDISWIRNPRVRLFVFVLMIKDGCSVHEAVDTVLSKEHITMEYYNRIYLSTFMGDWDDHLRGEISYE